MSEDLSDRGKTVRSRLESFLIFALCWSPIWGGILLIWLGVISPEHDPGVNFKTVCNDGTTSLSVGAGACSNHDGVAAYVPPEQQSEAMRQMDRIEAEIESDLRSKGLID